MTIQMPELTAPQRATLDKYLPWAAAAVGAWLLARGIRKTAWTLFGLYAALHWMH